MHVTDAKQPLAIAMWDFSWLERRYPGGGFEDWDRRLDELAARGYDAVRIDAFPHLLSSGHKSTWRLRPNGMIQGNSWGAPGVCDVEILPALTDFIAKCSDRDISVGLSTWFREDETDVRMDIETPIDLAELWIDTLTVIDDAGTMDSILYVDLCNEFPAWIRGGELHDIVHQDPDVGNHWMAESIKTVRETFPELDYSFSFTGADVVQNRQLDVSQFDFLNLHLWMIQESNFLDRMEEGSSYDNYYDALADRGEPLYQNAREQWLSDLQSRIDWAAKWSEDAGLPIVTTESWAIVHARDWPRLEWDWIKELCAFGARGAAMTGRWAAVSTSNFCEPQFRAMWRDVDWHRSVTRDIHSNTIEI